MKKRVFHIPVFVPHSGCPHDCVFCNQKKITGQKDEMTTEKAKEIIETHLCSIEKNNARESCFVEIAFFGGSFTAIDRNKMTELLSLANSYVGSGRVDGIRCSTRPDCISEDVLDICKNYSMTSIELGVQSADENVLLLSNRGHSFQDVENASKLIKSYDMELGLQMMTGLPGDSFATTMETAKKIAAQKPDTVRIYPTLVMEGTHLWEMYKKGEYIPQTLDEAVELVSELISFFEKENIRILRIGLQTTDEVNENSVIGPYHNAFAELCYARVMRGKIEKELLAAKSSGELAKKEFCYKTTANNVSKAVGHRGENKKYFRKKYGIDLKIVTI